MKILIVEDEKDMQQALCYGMRKSGYAVDAADNGQDAVELCEYNDYDLVILDLNLPGMDGLNVLKHIREKNLPAKVLILSTRCDISDKIEGLDGGASDYMTKPFHFKELEARVRVLLRRTFIQNEAALSRGGLYLDTNKKQACFKGMPIELSMREFSILEYLMMNMGRPVSAEELLEHVCDSEADPFSNQIKVYISTIRRKLAAFSDENIIKNIRGAGYVINKEDAEC